MKKFSVFVCLFLFVSCSTENSNSTAKNQSESNNLLENNTTDPIKTAGISGSNEVKNLDFAEDKKPIIEKKTKSSNSEKTKEFDGKKISEEPLKEDSYNETEMPQINFSKVYGEILSTFVTSSGSVKYSSLVKNKELLGQAITHFQENTPKSTWSSNQKLAYWINAYNLFTLKLVVDNFPTSSIKNIAGGKPWDKKFIELDGKTWSLNDLENGIIRKQFNEPRIHFAVNCASISCPKLLNQEYTAANLNSLLDKQTKRFINDKSENTFTGNSAQISSIFDWYKVDFYGGVISFLNKYLSTPLASDAKITYKDYNWNLND